MIKILIVDDYPENITALTQLLPENAEVHSANNADEALELVSRHDFGLALLDVQMPATSGFQLADIIRSVKKYKTLPIIFVTAHQQDSAIIFKSYESGAVDLLFKPLDPNIVRAKVQTFVELAQQRALLQTQVAELEQLRIDAESANLAKSQFLANMSHEIRTPLAAVMGFAEILSRGRSNKAEMDKSADAIKRNGELLMRLIDDILDLSKIEANKLEMHSTSFNLNDLLHDVESTMSFRARDKGVSLIFTIPKETTNNYVSDPVRIKQMLLNIIGNAIKFTDRGKVDISARIEPPALSRLDHKVYDELSISIKDEGIGLSPKQVENLFQPFAQADASTKRQFGGSGLGLYISRQIARAIGGDVNLTQTAVGKGSTFVINLRLERAAVDKNSKMASTSLMNGKAPLKEKDYFKGRKILAIDDSPDNLTLIDVFLEDSGADLTFAENGLKAISEARKTDFDLILMDLQMPGMDGYEATEEIRKMNFQKPIVALTAHVLRAEHDKCRKSGCNSVLTKPISREKLVAHLRQYLGD